MSFHSNRYVIRKQIEIKFLKIKEDEEMSQLQNRPVAEHILTVLKEHRGKGLCFADVKYELMRHGWFHVDSSISLTNKWLVQNGLIMKVGEKVYGRRYGIPEEGKESIEPIKLTKPIEGLGAKREWLTKNS
ncbi:MAG: hypothetical protein ABSE15_02470 [Candidatus Bathyarchaeia archaeon]